MPSILVVCTGNVCRSPIAEGLLRSALLGRFGSEAPTVSSAGTHGWEGSGAMPESVEAAREREIDISGHTARRLSVGMALESDLLLAMAGEHRDAIAGAAPQVSGKAFTLKELVRLLSGLPAAEIGLEGLAARLADADSLRRSGFEGRPHDEDISDPLGLPLDSYRAIAWELDEWTGRLVEALFGKVKAPTDIFGEREVTS